MRKCLSPFFIGRDEPGLEIGTGAFDTVISLTNTGFVQGSKNRINHINSAIRDFIIETVAVGEKPLILSGDCLSAVGCLAGLQQCKLHPYLLWFDAHGDFHTFETSISGHLGGMPLAMITGRGDQSLLAALNMSPLPDTNVFHVGGVDLELGEKEALHSSKIQTCNRITDVLSKLPEKSHFWIHFDTDYISALDAPAQRYPVQDGIPAQLVK